MPASQAVFLAVGAIGFGVLLISVLLGDLFGHDGLEHHIEIEHHVEIGHGHEAEGAGADDLYDPGWLSTKVIAASFVGFGAFGYVASTVGAPGWLSWPVAAIGLAAVGAGTLFLVLKPLARQQFNSLMSRYNYVGQEAQVTLEIEAGGTGQVTFRDRQGARVNQTARCDADAPVAKGAIVQIVDLVPGGVLVHHNHFSL